MQYLPRLFYSCWVCVCFFFFSTFILPAQCCSIKFHCLIVALLLRSVFKFRIFEFMHKWLCLFFYLPRTKLPSLRRSTHHIISFNPNDNSNPLPQRNRCDILIQNKSREKKMLAFVLFFFFYFVEFILFDTAFAFKSQSFLQFCKHSIFHVD